MMRRVFYISVPKIDGTEVKGIVHTSRRNNARRGVTGVLVYTGAYFGQLLEGEADDVASLLEIIRADPRHEDFKVRFEEPAEARWFTQWSMGYCVDESWRTPFPALASSEGSSADDDLRQYVKDLLYRSEAL